MSHRGQSHLKTITRARPVSLKPPIQHLLCIGAYTRRLFWRLNNSKREAFRRYHNKPNASMLHFSLCSFGELTCFSRENPRHVRACTDQKVISWIYHQLCNISLTEYMTYSFFINQTRPESILGLNSTIEHSRRFTHRWSISSSSAFPSPSISIFSAGFCLNFFMTIASFFVLYMSVKIN